MREREIRYRMGTSTTQRVLPVAEGVSDEDLFEIARRLTGLVYEREVTPWRNVLPPTGLTAQDHTNGDPCPTCDVGEDAPNPACASWVHPGNGPSQNHTKGSHA